MRPIIQLVYVTLDFLAVMSLKWKNKQVKLIFTIFFIELYESRFHKMHS